MAGVDLFEIFGLPSDEVARKLIVLLGLTPEQPRPQAADEQTADAA
jgi:hypothetical protein